MPDRGGLTLRHRPSLQGRSVDVWVPGADTARFPTQEEVVDDGAGGVELGRQHAGGGTLVWKECQKRERERRGKYGFSSSEISRRLRS